MDFIPKNDEFHTKNIQNIYENATHQPTPQLDTHEDISDRSRCCVLSRALVREGGVDGVLTVAHPPLGPELMDQLQPKVISNNGVSTAKTSQNTAFC